MNQRKTVFVMMVILLAVILTGCGRSEADTQPRMEKAEKLLNEKYGETFVVTEYLDDNARYKTFSVEAYASAYPDIRFDAIVDFEGEGMQDSYVSRRVSARVKEAMENAVGDMECSHFIHAETLETMSTMNDPDISVEAFLESMKKKDYMVYFYVDKSETDAGMIYDCMEKIAETIDCTSGYIQLFLSDQEMIEEVKDYVDTHRQFYGSYKDMTREDLVGSFRFEQGTLKESKEYLEEEMVNRVSEE